MNAIDRAFASYPRHYFLPDDLQDSAGFDAPLPIGFGQTNSQPTTVRLMLEWLEAERGNTVLDVGSGSGWTTALLSKIVGSKGKVYAVEKIPELVTTGRTNCLAAGVKNARFYLAGADYGLPARAPFDRILVSAAAQSLPQTLIEQLRVGGKMVIPVEHDVLEITKLAKHDIEVETHSGFVFVPLV